MRNHSFKLPKLILVVLSSLAWVGFALVTCFYFLLGILLIPVAWLLPGGVSRVFHQLAVWWAKGIIAVVPVWNIYSQGIEQLDSKKHYVIVANHQSLLDILVALASVPLHFKFLAKKELFPIPFLGWHMFFAGYIPIDRASRESGRSAIEKVKQKLKKKVSVLLFPEGTRSMDGEMREFKNGAFRVAQELNVEILPLVIDGTAQAIPKHSWLIENSAEFYVSIGKPVSPKSYRTLAEFKNHLHQDMAERLHKWRKSKIHEIDHA